MSAQGVLKMIDINDISNAYFMDGQVTVYYGDGQKETGRLTYDRRWCAINESNPIFWFYDPEDWVYDRSGPGWVRTYVKTNEKTFYLNEIEKVSPETGEIWLK